MYRPGHRRIRKVENAMEFSINYDMRCTGCVTSRYQVTLHIHHPTACIQNWNTHSPIFKYFAQFFRKQAQGGFDHKASHANCNIPSVSTDKIPRVKQISTLTFKYVTGPSNISTLTTYTAALLAKTCLYFSSFNTVTVFNVSMLCS